MITKWIKSACLALVLLLTLQNGLNAQEKLKHKPGDLETDSYVPGQILIKFSNGALDSVELEKPTEEFDNNDKLIKHSLLKEVLKQKGGARFTRVVRNLRPSHKKSISRSGEEVSIPDFYNLMRMEIPSTTDILALCRDLSKIDGIESVQPNYIRKTTAAPNDQLYGYQRGFEQSSDKDIDADSAWIYSTGSNAVKVGVMDTGIEWGHADLGVGFGTGFKVKGGKDYVNYDWNPADDNGHGTSCAGIIGATRNNSIGVAGLAGGNVSSTSGVSLYAFKIGDAAGHFYDDIAINAIVEASLSTPTYGYGCHILTNSWGGYGYNEHLREAIALAVKNNVIFVASSGNDNKTTYLAYPAAHDKNWVLAVGATDANDIRSLWPSGGSSNYGPGLDVVAPGGGPASVPSNVATTGIGGTYVTFTGTSAAAPHVAGLAALIKSVNPNLHSEDVQGIIKASADKISGYTFTNGYNAQVGYGRINAARAMEMMVAPFALDYYTAVGSSTVTTPYSLYYSDIIDVPGLSNGRYIVKEYIVDRNVTFPEKIKAYVWGRGANATVGYQEAFSDEALYGVGYCEVVSNNNTSATLRTRVYEVWSYNGSTYYGYYPTTPQNVNFAYTVLGKPVPPLSVSISGPMCVPNKGNLATLTANPSGGTGTYSYSWSGQTTQSITVNVSNCPDRFTVTVTSGTQTASASKDVFYSSGGCDCGGEFLEKSNTLSNQIPEQFELRQNYPNPFNPTTSIRFGIPEASQVKLKIYNIRGQEIRSLVNNMLSARYYDVLWDGKDDLGNQVSSGVYIYRLETGKFIKSKRMMLIK